MQEKRRIALVTGAYGSIGRHVSLMLATRGWEVHGIGHGSWGDRDAAQWGVTSWQATEISPETLRSFGPRPSLVIHCAGSGSVAHSVSAPQLDFQRTVGATVSVLEFMRTSCPEASLVYPSSAAVYGIAGQLPISEDLPLNPVSPYGVHKKVAEGMVRDYARLFNLRAAIVRLFSIYGEGFRKQLLWDACRRIVENESEFFGTGHETRDWLHVADAAELMIAAGDRATQFCPVVNGGAGVAVSVGDVVDELFALMGRGDRPQFCGTIRPGDPRDYQADIRRALQWGWKPQINWRDGLSRYVSWFKYEHGLK
ncbi:MULTISPECIES: NAD-dependent epimerase/dehydratase family protein [unclassified Sinorhizobium]|uniref:NAD-dependent epimerase/dehydratase family protein n=1 Tax=unclassified Sinorhizobium TaxID=2613772 RepID=UPI0035242E89